MMTRLPYESYMQVAVLGFGLSVHEFWQLSPAEFKALWQGYKIKEGHISPLSKSDVEKLIQKHGRTGVSIAPIG